MNREWHEIRLAPVDQVVETKIDDEHGERNHAMLVRQGRMWFYPDFSMYVYYTPTHWRRATPLQLEKLAREEEEKAQEHDRRAASLRTAITAAKQVSE